MRAVELLNIVTKVLSESGDYDISFNIDGDNFSLADEPLRVYDDKKQVVVTLDHEITDKTSTDEQVEFLDNLLRKLYTVSRSPIHSDWYIKEGMSKCKDGFIIPMNVNYQLTQEEGEYLLRIINEQLPASLKSLLKFKWSDDLDNISFKNVLNHIAAIEIDHTITYSPEALNDLG